MTKQQRVTIQVTKGNSIETFWDNNGDTAILAALTKYWDFNLAFVKGVLNITAPRESFPKAFKRGNFTVQLQEAFNVAADKFDRHPSRTTQRTAVTEYQNTYLIFERNEINRS